MKENLKKIKDFVLKNAKYVFPVIVCGAVAITVVIALKAGGVHNDQLNQIGETVTTSETESVASTSETEQETPLVKNEDPAITEAISAYYKALADGDEATLNAICDKVEELEMLWFLETANYVEYYPRLEIYTKPGYAEGETVAYVCFQVKLTGKDVAYPGFMWHYLCTAEDGSLYFKRTSLSNEANEYVTKINAEADVLELNNRVKVEFDDLMTQQPDLLAYMDDVSEDVRKTVGIELSNKKGETTPESTEGGNGEEGGEGENGQNGNGTSYQNEDANVEEVVYAVASTTVNVRKSDSEKAEKIGKVTGGSKVQVLEQLVNGWSKISFENKEGYIMSKFLKVQESALKYTPIGTVKATDNINVRADASTDSSKIGTLVKGDEVDLLAVEGEWCKINFKGQIAFVKAEYVERQ